MRSIGKRDRLIHIKCDWAGQITRENKLVPDGGGMAVAVLGESARASANSDTRTKSRRPAHARMK